MSNNTPDYEDNIEPQGDQSDARVVFHTDRTASTIKLIEEIERVKAENEKLKNTVFIDYDKVREIVKLRLLLTECRNHIVDLYGYTNGLTDKIDEVLK